MGRVIVLRGATLEFSPSAPISYSRFAPSTRRLAVRSRGGPSARSGPCWRRSLRRSGPRSEGGRPGLRSGTGRRRAGPSIHRPARPGWARGRSPAASGSVVRAPADVQRLFAADVELAGAGAASEFFEDLVPRHPGEIAAEVPGLANGRPGPPPEKTLCQTAWTKSIVSNRDRSTFGRRTRTMIRTSASKAARSAPSPRRRPPEPDPATPRIPRRSSGASSTSRRSTSSSSPETHLGEAIARQAMITTILTKIDAKESTRKKWRPAKLRSLGRHNVVSRAFCDVQEPL